MNFEKVKQPELAKHDSSVLDLAFVMDCTGSMGSYIQSATESIRQIVEEIVSLEKSDVRLGLVEYRDHPPQDNTFVTRTHDFTESVKEMKKWLEGCSAQGGGDAPEAVADALHDAFKLNWRQKSTKICVLISDAPPHGLNASGDGFPNGSPNGIDPLEVVSKMAEKGITLYAVGCEPALLPYKEFFSALAFKTGGQYVPLRNAKLLAKVIVGGAVEEISLEKLMAEVEKEVEEKRKQGITDEKVLSDHVHSKLNSRGITTNQVILNESNLVVSEEAKKYSGKHNLAELRKEYKTSAPSSDSLRKLNLAPGIPLVSTASFSSAPPASEDSYAIKNTSINYAQSERMVQKALKRNKE